MHSVLSMYNEIFKLKLKDVTIIVTDQYIDKELFIDAIKYPTFEMTFEEFCREITKHSSNTQSVAKEVTA